LHRVLHRHLSHRIRRCERHQARARPAMSQRDFPMVGLYVRKGIAYLPTHYKTEAGFYVINEPVEVVRLDDTAALTAAFYRAFARMNPIIPTPPRDGLRSGLLRCFKVRSWAQLYRESICWEMRKRGDAFELCRWKRRNDVGLEPDTKKTRRLSTDQGLDRFIEESIKVMRRARYPRIY
jgi:hypothetical protein